MVNNQHTMVINHNIVLFDDEQQRYFNLDALATLVWKLLQQPTTLREMVDVVVDHFELEPAIAEQNLQDVLAELAAQGLIETA